ncbi:MAG: 5'-methylthioadenosine phosphorylase, partial [uncultured Sphingomonadaceae bacterium]
ELAHRHHRRFRPIRHRNAHGRAVAQGGYALGTALRRAAVRPLGRHGAGVPSPPRARAPHPAERGQRPGERRRAQARGLHGPARHQLGWLAPRGARARPLRRGRSVHRPHDGAAVLLLRDGTRRPRLHGGADLPPPVRLRRCGGGRGGRRGGGERDLSGDGRAAVLHPGGEPDVPRLGRRRDRHDRDARSQARAGSGAPLRAGRHGHRLRLLARGSGVRRGIGGDRPDERQRRGRAAAGGRVRPRAAGGADSVAARHGARPRDHHGGGRARSGAGGEAGRGAGAGDGEL